MTLRPMFSILLITSTTILTACSGQTSDDRAAPPPAPLDLGDELEAADIDLERIEEPYTVFAPSPAALDAAASEHPRVFEDPDLRATVMKGHVVVGDLDPDQLRAADGTTLETLAGIPLAVTVDGDAVRVGGIEVGELVADTAERTYRIDGVIVPDALADG